MKFKTKFGALLIGSLSLGSANATYNVVERYKLLEDKFYTQEMLTPYGHDFIIDLGAGLNKNITDVIDEAKETSKTSGTDAEKLAAARSFLDKYDRTEQTVRIKFALGAPLPSFRVFGTKIIPDLRAGFGLGINIGIQQADFNPADFLKYISGVPSQVEAALAKCPTIPGGVDIVQYAINNCSLTQQEKDAAAGEVGKYFTPSGLKVPNLFAYAKADARVGLSFRYVRGKNWFGGMNLYGHGRVDIQQQITADTLANNSKAVGEFGEENTTINLATDLKFGYKNGNLKTFLSVEEIKIFNISNNEEEAGKLVYGNDPLLRLHANYKYKFIGFTVKPFAGVHKRSGYSLTSGLYGGSDLGFYIWGDRIGVRVRAMIDKEHYTLSPMMKLWLLNIEYALKIPTSSDIDGIKPSALHTANLRFYF